MSSILNNSAALSALQALTMTQQSLAIVQGQVSTGLKVGTAADNSSYWSIAAQLRSDSGVATVEPTAMHNRMSPSTPGVTRSSARTWGMREAQLANRKPLPMKTA